LDLSPISGARRGDRRSDFRVYWLAPRLGDDVCAKLYALIDPGAQQSNFIVGERPSRRHLQAAITVHDAADQLAGGAVSHFDDGAVIAAAQSILTQVKP